MDPDIDLRAVCIHVDAEPVERIARTRCCEPERLIEIGSVGERRQPDIDAVAAAGRKVLDVVAAHRKHERVRSRAAVERVEPAAAIQPVVAGLAVHFVIAVAARQVVVAAAREEAVIAAEAEQLVYRVVAAQGVGALIAETVDRRVAGQFQRLVLRAKGIAHRGDDAIVAVAGEHDIVA